ncbi:MAG: hypothetical protein ACN6O3_01515 [Comamonas sp.]
MSVENTAKDAVEKVHDTAQDVLDHAEDAVDSARGAARSAYKKAEHKLDQLSDRAAIDDFAARAQDLANRGINYAADTSHRARKHFHRAQEVTTTYVNEQPGKSLAMAMAAGAALATLVIMATRSRD